MEYHKGRYRQREWRKHLRPELKRFGNKRWRRTGKNIEIESDLIPIEPSWKKNLY